MEGEAEVANTQDHTYATQQTRRARRSDKQKTAAHVLQRLSGIGQRDSELHDLTRPVVVFLRDSPLPSQSRCTR